MVEDFAYLNARVQARRASLLREAAFQEALDLSFPDFLRFLSETAYGKELAGEGLAQVDRAIARTQARLVGDLPRLVGGRVKQAVDLLLLRHDLHNLQTVLRAKATGQPLEEALLLPGALKEGLWPQVFAAPDPPAMAQVLAATGHPLAPALRAALRSAQDPLQVEVLLAKRFWEGALEVAETLRDPVLRDHLALEVDAENLRTALKLQGQGVRPEDLFVQGGRFVHRLRFARLLEGDGSVLDELAGTPFAPLAGARDLKELERRLRCVLLKEARKAAAEAEGLGPVLAYVREREWEAVRLRLLARRAYYGLPRAQVEGGGEVPVRMAVIADPVAAQGFRLAGLEAHPAATSEEARARLEELVQAGRYALVAVDRELLPEPERAVERLMRGRDLPVLLTIPSLKEAFQSPDVEGYMRELVRRTIGFDIKL